MFNSIFNMVDNALSVGVGVFTGELPTQKQVARLISDGLSVTLIATMFGVGVDVIEDLLE